MNPAGRKIGRRIFNWLTLVSLLMGIGSAGLWLRGSHLVVREGQLPFFPTIGFSSLNGCFTVFWSNPDPSFDIQELSGTRQSFVIGEYTLLFYSYSSHFVAVRDLTLRNWFLLIFCFIAPIVWTIKYLRRQPQAGLCRKCGYDLRASKRNCPECGEPIASPMP